MERREYFRGTGDNRSMGGVWNAAHGASCQSRSCARSADKEGESVLIWAGVQTKLDWVRARGNVGTRLTKAFMLGGGLNGQKDTGTGCFPCKDGGTLRHLVFYSPSNGSN